MGGNRLTNIGDPSSAQDAASKSYVDALLQGFDWKASVRAASTTAGTLSSSYANGSAIDGVTLVTGDRILLKNQATGSENGIYTVNATGSPTRATDADSSAKVTAGLTTFVSEGTTNGNSAWQLTTDDTITLGTTSLVFAQVAGGATYTAGSGLSLTGSAFSVVTGTAGQVYIANGSGVLTPTTLSGDVSSVSSAGAVTLATTVVKTSGYIVRETPSGTINGSNVTFTLANTPVSGTEQVFLNGILQEPGSGNDYTISSSTITYLTAPATGDRLRVTYLK